MTKINSMKKVARLAQTALAVVTPTQFGFVYSTYFTSYSPGLTSQRAKQKFCKLLSEQFYIP